MDPLDQTEPERPAAGPGMQGADPPRQPPVDLPGPVVAAAENRTLDRRMRRQLAVAIVGANAVGALLVFVFLGFVVPTPVDADPSESLLLNLVVFPVFMAIAMAIGAFLSLRTGPRVSSWLVAGRAPSELERDFSLGQPIRLASISGAIWVAGALFFAALNAPRSGVLALEVGVGRCSEALRPAP